MDRIKDGNVVTPTDKAALDAFSPSWPTLPSGAAIHWMPHANSPVRFYVYPPAPANQILEVTYVRNPGEFTGDQPLGLPTTLQAAIADYVVGTAMSKDDEHVNNARAQAFLGSFAARVKGA